MKKIIFIFISLFLSNLYSQENSIFWKIQKDSTVSYILGTNHIFGKSLIEEDEKILSALKASSIVFLENIESKDSIVNNRSDFDFIEKLTANEKKTFKKIFKSNSNCKKQTSRELLLLTQNYWDKTSCLNGDFDDDKIFMDAFIRNYALKENKEVLGLEKISETLNYIETEYLKGAEESKIIASLRYKLNEINKGSISKNCAYNELY
ncbi:TraB/GumN family protein, partial [Flavobacterium sp.]|uniref:TraB/GumN family protein n=1 Tax=Flavobacterium sp. TaxID=239 RepID=UPI00391B7409